MRKIPRKETNEKFTAVEFNEGINEELQAIVEASGQAFNPADNHQIIKSILSVQSTFYEDTGNQVDNIHNLNYVSGSNLVGIVPITGYKNGMEVNFISSFTAQEGVLGYINIFNIGNIPIKYSNELLTLEKDKHYKFVYNEASNEFIITSINYDIVTNQLNNKIGSLYTNFNDSLKSIDSIELGNYELLLMNGQSFDKLEYPLLYERLGAEVLPDLRGQFLRHLPQGSSRALGSQEEDTMQIMKGTVSIAKVGGESETSFVIEHATGILDIKEETSPGKLIHPTLRASAEHSDTNRLEFDNSKVARTSSETRPKNIAVEYYIFAKTIKLIV